MQEQDDDPNPSRPLPTIRDDAPPSDSNNSVADTLPVLVYRQMRVL